jgi:DNA-binding SARP family transcriptional activator
VEALWGERVPGSAVGGLRTYVSGLRRMLGMGGAAGGPRIVALPGGYQLMVAFQELDLLAFERCADEGQRALADGQVVLAAARLRQALGLWRGRAFEDVPLGGRLDGELARLQERQLVVVEAWVEASLALGQHDRLVPELRQLVVAEPLRERLWGQWMLALYRSGRQAEALAAYQQLRGRLVEELGIEPSPPLQQLQRQILCGDVALALPDQQATGNGAPTGATVVVPRQPHWMRSVSPTGWPLPTPSGRLPSLPPASWMDVPMDAWTRGRIRRVGCRASCRSTSRTSPDASLPCSVCRPGYGIAVAGRRRW